MNDLKMTLNLTYLKKLSELASAASVGEKYL